MKNLALLLITFISFSTPLLAQNEKVVLCGDYNKTDGTPSDINKNWDIEKEKGSYVYVLYSQDKIIKDKLMLYLDKKNTNGSYIAYETLEFTYDPIVDKKNWAMYDCKFTEAGDYRISVMGKGDDALALVYANIAYLKSSDDDKDKVKEAGNDDAGDTFYYEDAKITFGESVTDGEMTGEATEFRLISGKREITCMLQQDKDLKCEEVTVTIYGGTDYKDKISDEKFTVASLDWDWIKMPITVRKIGKYVVNIYNQEDTFIGSGYFEIIR